jgi:ribonuclease BN (tRNA processing enzyme)
MKVKIVGHGGGFAGTKDGNANFLFEHNGKRLLLDNGITAPFILRDEWGMSWSSKDIDAMYISHLHDDHAGGLSVMALCNYFTNIVAQGGDPFKLYCSSTLVDEIWEHIKRGLDTIEGVKPTLDTFFDVQAVPRGDSFHWEGWTFELIQTLHVVSGNDFMHSYGLMVYDSKKKNAKKTFFTTDTQFTYPCPLQVHYNRAHAIFHDGEHLFKSGVHAWIPQMAEELDEETKAKTYFTHYTVVPENADKLGFAGFVRKGEEYTLS